MTNYLEIVLDLLNLEGEEKQAFLAIGEVIAHHTNKTLTIYHRMGFLFEAWFDLLLEKISLEDFLATGDISSSRFLFPPVRRETAKLMGATAFQSSLELLQCPKSLDNLEQNSILLLDEISFLILSASEQKEIQKILEEKDILLLLC